MVPTVSRPWVRRCIESKRRIPSKTNYVARSQEGERLSDRMSATVGFLPPHDKMRFLPLALVASLPNYSS